MKQLTINFFKYWLFWLLLFAFYRLFFIISYFSVIHDKGSGIIEIFSTFYYALKLDMSAISYFFVLPMLLSFIWLFYQKKWIAKAVDIYTFLVIIIYSFISFGEIGIYDEWRTKLNYKALAYFQHPLEIFNSISTIKFIFLFIGVVATIVFWCWFYNKKFRFLKEKFKVKLYIKATYIVFAPLFVFYFMRGGIQEIPISQSQSWFSKNQVLNDAAVNSGYNIFKNIIDMQAFMKENPFKFFDDVYAQNIVKEIHKIEKDTTIEILNNTRPNIVLVILESWTADLIGALGNDTDITPNFNKLAEEGILFTNLYSSGNRSQQGMGSIFSGFPAIPITTITEHQEKYSKLPSFTRILNQKGYHSSFYFGGQLIYGNIKSYIMYNQFAKIVEGDDFSSKIPKGKLGVHDEYLFNRNIEDLKSEKEPFFSAMFTLSSHSPYDQPIKNKITRNIKEKEFVNSAFYTDYALGKYFSEAKKQSWYKNTLFVLVADHSHVSHKSHALQSFEYHQIPLLLFGDVIKPEFKGTKINKIASQTDIPATLLKQLNFDASAFPWSKNLFNPYSPEFAYFEMNDGVGWKRPDGYFIYSKTSNSFLDKKLNAKTEKRIIEEGKSYLQEVFRQFLEF